MTKHLLKTTASLALGFVLAANSALAGTKTFKEEVVVVEEPAQWWNAELSTGWDSLYMFRGVNVLRGAKSYGSSIQWTDLSVTFNLTENDALTVGTWLGFGLGNANYNEVDAYLSYTHSFGNLDLTVGYTFYDVMSASIFSNELNAGLAYEFDLGFMTITPGLIYYFNIGPDTADSGIASCASSFLQFRVDSSIPVYKDGAVAIEPWAALGVNFRYNFDENGNTYDGLNNLELGLALPIQLSKVVSVSPYVAYSQALNSAGLLGTERATVWGGASVTFSF